MTRPPPRRADFTPRYFVIEQALREQIDGASPHDPLPSETELSQRFGVSRMTARAAVQRLVADGLVYRESGRGTFVAAPETTRRLESIVCFSDKVRSQGRTPSSRMLTATVRPTTEEERTRLRLAPDADVVALSRLRMASRVPVAVQHSVLPGRLRALLDADLETSSLHAALTELGSVPSKGYSNISAAAADDEEAKLLSVARHCPLLAERRLVFDQYGRPLELAHSHYVGTRYQLDVTYRMDAAPREPRGRTR